MNIGQGKIQQNIEAGLGFSPSMICRCLPRIRYMYVAPTASSQGPMRGTEVIQCSKQYGNISWPLPSLLLLTFGPPWFEKMLVPHNFPLLCRRPSEVKKEEVKVPKSKLYIFAKKDFATRARRHGRLQRLWRHATMPPMRRRGMRRRPLHIGRCRRV